MMTGCETVRAELPAYIAGELDDESTGLVERHVADCRDCARELDDLRAVVDILVRSPVGAESPPPDLEEHVFASVELEPVAAMVAGAPIKHEPPLDLERRALEHAGVFEQESTRWPRVRAALVPGLAVVTVVFGALGFNWRDESAELRSTMEVWENRYGEWGQTMQSFHLAAQSDPGARARAELVRSTHHNYTLVLWIERLDTVAPGYHYEVWLAGANGRVPAGSFRVETSGEVVRNFSIGVDPRGFPTVQVTLEPDAGSPALTGPTVMEAQLDLSG
jgi:hypothetical protein